jgi:hypothetical protein
MLLFRGLDLGRLLYRHDASIFRLCDGTQERPVLAKSIHAGRVRSIGVRLIEEDQLPRLITNNVTVEHSLALGQKLGFVVLARPPGCCPDSHKDFAKGFEDIFNYVRELQISIS